MATSENENIYNVQGYLKANMIILHSKMYDHEDSHGSVYIPRIFAVNYEHISALEEIKLKKNLPIKNQVKTTIYFANRESVEVYESIGEILDLISQQLAIQDHFKNKNNY